MKIVSIDGINVFVEKEEEYKKLCEKFKENVKVYNFEDWTIKSKVRCVCLFR